MAPILFAPQIDKKVPGKTTRGHGTDMVNATGSRDVATTLSFITPTSDFNRRYIAPSDEVNTGVYNDYKVVIKDARPNRSSFTFDDGGFVLVDHKSNVEPFPYPS